MAARTAEKDAGSWRRWHTDDTPLRLGSSACLLGDEVRFDGGHARDRFVTDVLGQWIEWVKVCPEVDIGMNVPRPTIRLVNEDDGAGVRLVAPSTGEDFTAPMDRYAAGKVRELKTAGIDGFVLKKNSPSCGLERLTIYRKGHRYNKHGVGRFAEALVRDWPNLPVEEDGRLNDAKLRENFIERVFCHNRWRAFLERRPTRGRLVEFHTAHKLLLRAHDEAAYGRLGKLVGEAGKIPDRELFARYEEEFHAALRTKTTPRRHANVLQHAMGHLKTLLSPQEKQEILTAIDDYRNGMLPLIVPLTLLRFNIVKFQVDYLLGQLYFDPHPKELMLRNHV